MFINSLLVQEANVAHLKNVHVSYTREMNDQLKQMNEFPSFYFVLTVPPFAQHHRLNFALSEEQHRFLNTRKQVETVKREMNTAENEIATMEQLLALTGIRLTIMFILIILLISPPTSLSLRTTITKSKE